MPTQRRQARLDAVNEHEPVDDHVSDPLLELSSIDMTVTFFEDRLHYHRRLGSRHGEITYHDVRSLRLHRRASRLVHTSDSNASALALTKKMTLRAKGQRHDLTFDFRHETLVQVKEAFTIVQRGMPRTTAHYEGDDVES